MTTDDQAAHDDTAARLDELYAQLPVVACKGECGWNTCGPIGMSVFERKRIQARGVEIPEYDSQAGQAWEAGARLNCPALNRQGQCSVYDIRPLICRAWGAGRGNMWCRHGCQVTGKRFKAAELTKLLIESYRIGGAPASMGDGMLVPAEILDDPVVAQLMWRFTQGEKNLAPQLEAAMMDVYERLGSELPAPPDQPAPPARAARAALPAEVASAGLSREERRALARERPWEGT